MTAPRLRGIFAWTRSLFPRPSGRRPGRRDRQAAAALGWDGLEDRRVLSSMAVALPAGIHDAPLVQMIHRGASTPAPLPAAVDIVAEESLDAALVAALEQEAARPDAIESMIASFSSVDEDVAMLAVAELVAVGALAMAIARVSEDALSRSVESRLVPVRA